MATNIYIQYTNNGKKHLIRRSVKQGRKPSGLGKPILIRLFEFDEEKIRQLQLKFGEYWNLNEFIRTAVSKELSNSIYTELFKQ